MRIERLTRAVKKGVRETVGTLTLDPALGVVGDCRSAADGSVSLLSGEAERAVRDAGGLCGARFAANLVTGGLDYALLRAGTRLRAGACEITIVRAGKPCYDECPLKRNGATCPLPGSCAFARVLRGGELRTGDTIAVIEEK